MMKREPRHNPSDMRAARADSSSNRYILLAVIAVAAVLAVYLIRSNMETPQTAGRGDGTETSPAGLPASGEGADSAMMEDIAHQIEHVRTVLAKDSSNFDAWVALGNLYFDARIPEEAIMHYRQALRLHPGDVNVMTDMATMQREAGRPAEAAETLTQVVAIDSTHPQSWFNLGVIYAFDLKNSKEAIASWRKFLALSPPLEHADAVRREIERLEKESGS